MFFRTLQTFLFFQSRTCTPLNRQPANQISYNTHLPSFSLEISIPALNSVARILAALIDWSTPVGSVRLRSGGVESFWSNYSYSPDFRRNRLIPTSLSLISPQIHIFRRWYRGPFGFLHSRLHYYFVTGQKFMSALKKAPMSFPNRRSHFTFLGYEFWD